MLDFFTHVGREYRTHLPTIRLCSKFYSVLLEFKVWILTKKTTSGSDVNIVMKIVVQ